MKMRDTTLEANSGENMADYYLYHAQSEDDRWAVAVEQAKADSYHVSVLFKEPEWELFGVIRYWDFDDRALAEARYLELQTLFGTLPPTDDLKQITAALPPVERRARPEAAE